ncbi:MAG: PPK2 family polyphosphate kinase [Bacteroidota bacterium]
MSKLNGYPTTAPTDIKKEDVLKKLSKEQDKLSKLQDLLYANEKHSLLIILQGLDASGKDSTIKHVFSCVNPMGCNVKSFKKPTEEEQRHGFLWRIYQHLPAKGMIQIFNRSHYEDILVPTVHKLLTSKEIEPRYDFINSFEQHLLRNNTLILKFFLNISEEYQLQKLERRKSDPTRKWKYDKADKTEQKNRSKYLKVYKELFKRCSPEIPWEIIPANDKWYRDYLIATSVVKKLETLKMDYPKG